MIFANYNGRRSMAQPDATGNCPGCNSPVIAKCGDVKVWHWAHVAGECDAWSEPESLWHLNWKAIAPPERREVVMSNHRADIVAGNGHVVELQHSSISSEEIRERERFYKRMIWILDGADFEDRFIVRDKGDHCTFVWKWARVSWGAATCPILIDFGQSHLFEICKFYANSSPAAGWGKWGNLSAVERFIRGNRAALINQKKGQVV